MALPVRRAALVVVPLALVVGVGPVLLLPLRQWIPAAERARIDAAWAEVEAWARDEEASSGVSPFLADLARTAGSLEPSLHADLIPPWTAREDLPASWRRALADVEAWASAPAAEEIVEKVALADPWPVLHLFELLMGQREVGPLQVAAVLRAASEIERGSYPEFSVALRQLAIDRLEEGGSFDPADADRWRPWARSFLRMGVRTAVERDLGQRAWIDDAEDRFHLLLGRRLASDALLPLRGTAVDAEGLQTSIDRASAAMHEEYEVELALYEELSRVVGHWRRSVEAYEACFGP